jgi:ABC-type transport system involved in cytochrome c biogenesis permease subunit
MATSELTRPRSIPAERDKSRQQISALEFGIRQVLAAFASLRLTVVLFALSIFLIFVGTLAQKDNGVWYVVDHTYFRVWFARVDFLVFERLVQVFSKGTEWNLSGGFYFPGGKLIGLFLLLNLAAAHSVRFKIAAKGRRLVIGVATIAVGLAITYFVIQSGMNQAIESELSPAFCDMLWQFFRGTLAIATLVGVYGVLFLRHRMRSFEWGLLLVLDVLLGLLTVWLLANPEARLDDSGLRILWQLVKGTGAGLVLLAGCVMVFRKRAGIVLLHGGIALMMLSEMLTGIQAQESLMTISEGAAANFSEDIRASELAVIDRSHVGHDHVTVVPDSLLQENVGSSQPIEHEDLPFNIQVHRWMPNSQVRGVKAGEPNPATAGFGKLQVAEQIRTATGVGEDAQKTDHPAAYIELVSKSTGRTLGTYLVWVDEPIKAQTVKVDGREEVVWVYKPLKEQPVEVDGRTYDFALRFERIYHPFSIALKEFDYKHYTGTDTAKSYSSLVVLQDPERNVDRETLIWMNNPLRYAGITVYQSSFREFRDQSDLAVEQQTVLQVVKNPSWMAPYVACMLVATGMLAHFGIILFRFLRRRAEEPRTAESRGGNAGEVNRTDRNGHHREKTFGSAQPTSGWTSFAKWFPALIVVVFAAYILSKTRMPESKSSEMQIYEFGKLPLAYQGRIKPYDTLARNTLQIISSRQQVDVWTANGKVVDGVAAIHWLLDAISGHPRADDHHVFRIENLDVLDTLGLERRPVFWRYSLNEILKKGGELERQVSLARATPEEERSLFQHKMLDLSGKYSLYSVVVMSFRSPPVSMSSDMDKLMASLQESYDAIQKLHAGQMPHAVPPKEATTNWTPLVEAEFRAIVGRLIDQPVDPATLALRRLLSAYALDDAATFNQQLSEYRRLLANYENALNSEKNELQKAGVAKSEILAQPKINFEVFYNYFSPFYYATVLYLFAFMLGVMSWVGWTEPLRRGSIWLLWFTFALHTFALVARVYISGRPPITNLYTTAIFIGWAAVLKALVFEAIYRIGLGNIVASVIGFLTLIVAYNLSLDGDTFIVLQAVLDTQFWLATHVVAINLGYAATYKAGAWGALYILCAHVFPVLDEDGRRVLVRIIYGTLCFAIFFSFVGTVLGGLWADDSWGRFWGWDPKENGALMIVLWNALVLHARWGGLVKGRGLATLAVGGNIITTWSYFGVNELNLGLHSYGASEKNTAMWLLIFSASQLALIGLGMMPRRWFEAMGSLFRLLRSRITPLRPRSV